jgi:hypothetical protein
MFKIAILVLFAAAMSAPGAANAVSLSGQCGSIRGDAVRVYRDIETIRQGGRFANPGWCASVRSIIRALDHTLSVINRDPSRCQETSERIETFESLRTKMMTSAEGCP